MSKQELLKGCRYYKGEDECPAGVNPMLWNYEKCWCDFSISESPLLRSFAVEYHANGLDMFHPDGVPLSLKALLFNRYDHWAEGGPNGFKLFYLLEYLNIGGGYRCRYFEFEDVNPFTPNDVKFVFWECEKRWLNATESHKSKMLDQYTYFGLDDHKKNDGVPMSLKAEILNWHYQHGGDYETAKGFERLYSLF